MAVLELARSVGAHGFAKYVAVKRIAPKWVDDPEFIAMFLDEARLAAVLDHPNVVRVHDLGHDSTGPFFVMDYIHGEDLQSIARAQAGPLPTELVLAIGIAAADGLHHAHTRRDFDGNPLGLIHRDVSPSNVLVTYDGGVKLVDFGIAKVMGGGGTRPSIRKGKIGYMSPEQCKGAPLDARSDVFALGIVLWELLTGQRLFDGDNEFVAMNRIVNHDAPAVRETNPEVPTAVADVVHRALSRNPSDRWPDAKSMARALEDAAHSIGLRPSTENLAAFMADVFGRRPYPWESAAPELVPTPEGDTDATRVVTPPSEAPAPASPAGRPLWLFAAPAVLVAALLGWWLQSPPTEEAAVPPTPAAKPSAPAPEPETTKPPEPIDAPPQQPVVEATPAALPQLVPDVGSRLEEVEEPEVRPKPKKRPRRKRTEKRPARAPDASDAPAFDPDGLGPVRSVLK